MVSDHPDFWTRSELEKAVEATEQKRRKPMNEAGGAASGGKSAGGQGQPEDEQSTGTTLRDLPVQYQDRSRRIRGAAITVIMVAVALGFACCENLLYVFVFNDNTLETELTVLCVRMFFPIHPILAAVQSIGVCKRDIEHQPNNELGRTLLPAIILHGCFDYSVIFTNFLNPNYTSAGVLVTIILCFTIEFVGLIYYFVQSRAQNKRIDALDQADNIDRAELI
jgi:hypothetical protein